MRYRSEAEETRQRYVPDIIVAQNERRQVRLHQFVGQGVELGTWRRGPGGEWVRSKEAMRLKRWEAEALIISLTDCLEDRKGKGAVKG